MQLHKILQYNFVELLKISAYRGVYKILITHRKYRNRFCYKDYCICTGANLQLPQSFVASYSDYVVCNDKVINIADNIIDGNIYLFGNWYKFDYQHDWLKDIATGNYWDNHKYANDAAFRAQGFADVKYILEPNKLNPLVSVAHAYYLSKDEKYIAFINKAIDGWISCVPVERSVANRIVMDIAYRAINLIHISVLCRDSLPFQKEVFPKIVGILKHHENYMWCRLGSRWFKSNNDNNHNVGEIVGLYVTQIWLSNVLETSYKKRKHKELQYLRGVLDKIIAESGAYIEQSGNYTKVVAEFLMLFELFIKNFEDSTNDIITYEQSSYLERICGYLNNISHNGIIDNFGDNDGALVLIPFEQNEYSYSHLVKYAHINNANGDYSDASQFVYNSNDSNSLHVFTRAGRFAYYVEGAYIHAHNDLLSILVSVKGTQLFVDKGCYYYNSGLDIRKDYVQLRSHNNVSIDNLDSSELMSTGNRSYPESHMLEQSTTDNTLHFAGSLSYRYVTQKRTIDYKDNCISIMDQIEVTDDQEHFLQISFLLGPNVDVKIKNMECNFNDYTNNTSFFFSIKGVNSIDVVEDVYYPTYGKCVPTKRIIATRSFTHSTDIETQIRIL